MTESAAAQRVAVLPVSDPYNSNAGAATDSEIYLLDTGTLERTGLLRLPSYLLGNRSFAAHGKWLFFDKAGTSLYVVMQADSTSGLLNDFSIQTYNFANPAPCVPSVSTSTISVSWNGTTATFDATAPGTCQYTASTSAAWLQILQGSVRSGSGSISYHARANLTGAARSATMTIGGQTITVTQEAAPAPLPVTAQMSYRVIDAEFSAPLDRVILVASGPNELHLFNPATWADQVVGLAKAPLSVSVRPDGMYAAVGHDGWISIVNLQTAQVENLLEMPATANEIVLDASGYVYPFSGQYYSQVVPVEIATGKWTVVSGYSTMRTARLHPGGAFLYGGDYSLYRWVLNAGSLTLSQQINSPSSCNNLWFSQDGLRVYTRCGTVYRSSATPAQDLLSNGSFSGLAQYGSAEWVDHSAARGMAAVVSSAPSYSSTLPGLQLYGDEFLGLSSSRAFPKVRVGTNDVQLVGRYVFWGGNGTQLYVFTRQDPGYNVPGNETYATLVAPNIGTGGCTATVNGPAGALAAAGDSGAVTVSSGEACNWTASSSAAWLRITAGTFGLGSGSVLFSAERNPYGLARTATITAGGQVVTVTQGAGAAVTAPTLVGATPANPALAATAIAFTLRDLDGTSNLARVYFQIGADSVVAANGCHGFYDRPTNALFLYNDGLTAPQGPLTPGVAGTVENGQCRLSGAASAVTTTAGTDLVLTLGLELKGSYLSGSRKIYLWTTDAQGNGTGWLQTGTWTVAPTTNLAPAVVPGGGTLSGASQTVTLQARDGNGNNDISRLYFVLNATASVPAGSCHGFYDRAVNGLFLYNDALTTLMGPFTPGAVGTLQNSQCAIDVAASSVALPTSTDVVVTLAMRMQGGYATGTRNVYAWAQDKQVNNTGWVQTATWTMTPSNVAPTVVSGTPATVSTLTQTLNFTVRDGDGYANLSRVYFLINPTVSVPANTCHGFYERANNSYYLYSDGLSVLAGPVVAGTAGTLQNSQCQISVGSSPVTGSGTDLLLALNVTVRGTFAGTALRVALWAQDAQANGTGWVQTGTWAAGVTGGPVAPTLATVSPSTASATSQTFTVTARDGNGNADVSRVYFQLHLNSTVAVNTCHGFYDRAQNAVYLYNDALTGLSAPLQPGTAGSISNGQCSVDGGALNTSGSGNDFVLTLPMTLKGSYVSGQRTLFFWILDQASLGTGWQQGATWISGAPKAPTFEGYMGYGLNGPSQPLSVLARDLDGVADLNRIYFVLNTTGSVTPNSCHGFYDRVTGSVYLYNDALTGLVSGAVRPGVNSTVANSQCSISGLASTVSLTSIDLALTLSVTRLGTFATTTRNVYWWATDNGGLGTGWVQGSTWAP